MTDAAETPQPTVLDRVSGGVGHLTLNRPRALNALDLGMIHRLTDVLDEWRDDPDVDVVVLDGAGDRGLCAGGDVRGLYEQIVRGRALDTAQFFRAEYALNAAIGEYPKPVVALADGITMGGGIGLAGHAAVRVVTERSRLAMPETRIGFAPDVGGTWLLAHAPGRIGEYLGLTGATMDAADALYAGFADVFVPSDRLADLRRALQDSGGDPAEVVRSHATPHVHSREPHVHSREPHVHSREPHVHSREPHVHSRESASGVSESAPGVSESAPGVGESASGVRESASGVVASRLEAARAWIDDAFAADTVPDILDRLRARREPEASATADTLDELSPTGMAVTLEAVRRARGLPDLRAALAQEYGLVMWFVTTQPDLVEGIRAQLVDKDRSPTWHPASPADVSPDAVASAFSFIPPVPLWG